MVYDTDGFAAFNTHFLSCVSSSVSDKEPPQGSAWRPEWLESLTVFSPHHGASELNVDREESPDFRDGFTKTNTGWRLTFEWAALQPR
jgi:hypothetical protein